MGKELTPRKLIAHCKSKCDVFTTPKVVHNANKTLPLSKSDFSVTYKELKLAILRHTLSLSPHLIHIQPKSRKSLPIFLKNRMRQTHSELKFVVVVCVLCMHAALEKCQDKASTKDSFRRIPLDFKA